MKEDDVLLTLPQVAGALDVSHVTAWRIVVKEKRIPAEKHGQMWLVWQSAVDAYRPKMKDRPTAGRPRSTTRPAPAPPAEQQPAD